MSDEVSRTERIVQAMLDAAGNVTEEITPDEHAAVLWMFISLWMGKPPGAPLHLLDYDEMLFPDAGYKFTSIPRGVFEDLQRKATRLLLTNTTAPESLIQHWHAVQSGRPPFGYKILE